MASTINLEIVRNAAAAAVVVVVVVIVMIIYYHSQRDVYLLFTINYLLITALADWSQAHY